MCDFLGCKILLCNISNTRGLIFLSHSLHIFYGMKITLRMKKIYYFCIVIALFALLPSTFPLTSPSTHFAPFCALVENIVHPPYWDKYMGSKLAAVWRNHPSLRNNVEYTQGVQTISAQIHKVSFFLSKF